MCSARPQVHSAPKCSSGKTVTRNVPGTGNRQSPVNIVTKDVTADPHLRDNPLHWKDTGLRGTSISNTGNTWLVSVKAGGPNLHGGPLQHDYQMEMMHGHWGKTHDSGSEHAVDGKRYAGELHLVHFNADKYKSFVDAAASEEGLVVVAVFLKEGTAHPQLKSVVDCIPYIKYKGMKCALQQPLDVSSLIPPRSTYWTYEGSLTTPPWSENVTWIVYKQPIEVSPEQLASFRKLLSYEEAVKPQNSTDGPIDCNVRATQPLKHRIVREPPKKQDSRTCLKFAFSKGALTTPLKT
ncbi:carbonic anhydrase 1 [Rhipicephalus sanguineus]|uniref:carbonic anhydrase 1 n=1 Tax=Rhipicephalus sanguineus TaxID=34632 RepID=UPI001894FE44|nr:carbonic anhydrase 1 [Rhipicephalus sanguineus]